jgi:hypothetical protein
MFRYFFPGKTLYVGMQRCVFLCAGNSALMVSVRRCSVFVLRSDPIFYWKSVSSSLKSKRSKTDNEKMMGEPSNSMDAALRG